MLSPRRTNSATASPLQQASKVFQLAHRAVVDRQNHIAGAPARPWRLVRWLSPAARCSGRVGAFSQLEFADSQTGFVSIVGMARWLRFSLAAFGAGQLAQHHVEFFSSPLRHSVQFGLCPAPWRPPASAGLLSFPLFAGKRQHNIVHLHAGLGRRALLG